MVQNLILAKKRDLIFANIESLFLAINVTSCCSPTTLLISLKANAAERCELSIKPVRGLNKEQWRRLLRSYLALPRRSWYIFALFNSDLN